LQIQFPIFGGIICEDWSYFTLLPEKVLPKKTKQLLEPKINICILLTLYDFTLIKKENPDGLKKATFLRFTFIFLHTAGKYVKKKK